MSRIGNYTTGNLLDYSNHQNYYKLIGIDLSRQKNTTIPHQINFIEKLEGDDGAIFSIAQKQQKTILDFSKLFICHQWYTYIQVRLKL